MGGISADQAAGTTYGVTRGLWWVSDHRVVSACLLGAWVLVTVGGLVHCRVLEQQAPSSCPCLRVGVWWSGVCVLWLASGSCAHGVW